MASSVMIVDDADVIRLVLRDLLTENGFQVVGECSNGLEAVAKYKELRPDVVTLDITMPEQDGLWALEHILAEDPSAKVVMVTAVDERNALIKAIRLGARDYIVKPFEEERVLSAIKKVTSPEE